MTRATLYGQVWGDEGKGDDYTLDAYVSRLRGKLIGDGSHGYLETLKEIGFKFEVTGDV